MDRILYTILIVAVVALILVLIDKRLLCKIPLENFDRWVAAAAISEIAVLVAVAVFVYTLRS